MSHARALWTAALLLLPTLVAAQDAPDSEKKPADEVVQLKDGSLLVGKILSLSDAAIEMELKGGGRVTHPLKDVSPYSIYRLKVARIDPNSAQAHFELGEFCMAQGVWSYAILEFDRAAALDKSLADRARRKRDEAMNEDARTKFEEAKRLIAEKRYEDAERLLSVLLTTYRETPWAKEAQNEIARVSEEIRKDIDAKKRQLEDKARARADAAARAKEDAEKALYAQTAEALDEAKKLWSEGLDWEGKANLTKADRAWKTAELRLLGAKKNMETLLKSTDANLLKQSKELDRELDSWLVKTYYRLGRMWAVELNYAESLLWLNRGLRLQPDHHDIGEIVLTITQLQMRKRATGAGY